MNKINKYNNIFKKIIMPKKHIYYNEMLYILKEKQNINLTKIKLIKSLLEHFEKQKKNKDKKNKQENKGIL